MNFSNIFEVSGSIQYFTGSIQEDQPPYATLWTHIFQEKKRESIRALEPRKKVHADCLQNVPFLSKANAVECNQLGVATHIYHPAANQCVKAESQMRNARN